MHKFLKAVGFSKIAKRKEIQDLICDVVEHSDEKIVVEDYPEGPFAEYRKYFSDDAGLAVCGQVDENHTFHVEYYYPFFEALTVTTKERITVERLIDREAYAGGCDDMRIGITLIFYLQNPAQYMLQTRKGVRFPENMPVSLTALASEGKILFPVQKDKEAVRVDQEMKQNRNHLMEAARNGDEEAMESLTMEDMDTYSMISHRIVTDDVLTIVDSYFMPKGIECDQYSVLGEIKSFSFSKNYMTSEELVLMTLESNDMTYDVCINRADLLGEPEVGRRFKGVIWLQGDIIYED
ncbi:MAG: DUF3881 family protein [Clostridiales bacterium]|nr:DUF3881 family protein [Candidatus Blautia equi]